MTIQPKYHWQFTEKDGHIARDTTSGVQGRFHQMLFEGHGRIGHAVKLSALDSRMTFEEKVGQFGTKDFTVAFGIKLLSTFDQNDTDIIGNRDVGGHGNWFSLRLQDKGKILFFEVDEDSRGKNYARAQSQHLPSLNDQKWHHVAIVRAGKTIRLYFDGSQVATGTSKTGVANIRGSVATKLGHYTRHTPAAQYEDLRIYHTALSAAQVKALVPPVNRPLRQGEIELVAADNAAVILNQNVDDLSPFSSSFKQLRVANNTGVTLYQNDNYNGTAQKCYADLPDMRRSRLKTFPKSIRIWSSVGEPFTGKWIIKAPNGQFLHAGKVMLTTAPQQFSNGLFKFHYNLQQARLQLLPGTDQESDRFILSPVQAPVPLFIDDSDSLSDEFSLTNQANNEWLELVEGRTFSWTQQKERRAVFVRAVKFAENEGQVGELAAGEVALYEHGAYHGRTWIFSDSANVVSGEHSRFGLFQNLNDIASSIRLGPDTGVTLFKHFNYQVAESKREEEIEDIIKNVPAMRESQIGNDALSSIKIFRTLEPENVFSSYTTKLSQDYHMVGDTLEEFSAYRTTLRFKPGAGAIEVSATDVTQIEVEGTTYDIDEERSVTLRPNQLNMIMITSEADGLNTPGLKIRTSTMGLNERVVIFPNQEAHRQIAELEGDALWNAKDAKGNLIVDRRAHTQAEVASAQNTVKRVMATVAYNNDAPVKNSRVLSSNRGVSGATIDNPWELSLGTVAGAAPPRDDQQSIVVQPPIEERPVSSDEWQQLLAEAISADDVVDLEDSDSLNGNPVTPSFSIGRGFGPKPLFRRLGRRIKRAIKKAASVVIGKVKDVVHVIVKTAEGVIDFVVDTVEKVADFVEAVVEKVVKAVKQFIEFLQFLFNWDDILKTQRALVKTINSACDSASALVASAKPTVSNFIDEMRDGLNEGTDSLIEALGVDPEEVDQGSEFELPEAAEWFLNKLFGGSKSSKSETTPSSNRNAGTSFESALRNLLDALKDAAGIGIEAFDGLIDVVEIMIKNPLRPELALASIIDTFRDIGIKILDLGESLMLTFLDLVVTAIELFRDLLNQEIRIPFISDLFKLLGAGKLTILNVVTLLLAIPVTVVSKLISGEAPLLDDTSVEFPTATPAEVSPVQGRVVTTVGAPVSATVGALVGPAVNASAPLEQQPVMEVKIDDSPTFDFEKTRRKVSTYGNIALIADTINGILTTFLDLPPESADDDGDKTAIFEISSLVLSGVSWLASFPASTVEPGGYPYNIAHSKHNVSKSANEQEYWERVMWGWRTSMLGLDIVYMLASFKFDDLASQRLRRGDEITAGLTTVLSAIDLGITGRYLATTKGEDNRGILITSEVVPIMPSLFCGLRFSSDPVAFAARIGLNGVAAGVPLFLGPKLLRNDLAALEE